MSAAAKLSRLMVVLALCLLVGACKSKVTKANYDRIKEGMTLAEVEAILGKGTKDTGDGSNVAGQFGVALPQPAVSGAGDIYKWEGGAGTITLTFRDGKVVHRSGF
jgi:hypothetical protein